MRASVSSNEIASARISCSDKSLKFFAKGPPPLTNQGCEYHFFGASGDADFIRRRSDGYLAVSGVQFLEAPSSDISRQEVQLPHGVLDHLIHIVAVGFV